MIKELLLYYLVIVLLLNESECLLIYDISTIRVDDYGLLSIDHEVMSFDMFYYNWGGLLGCDDHPGLQKTKWILCDIAVLSISYSNVGPIPDKRHLFPISLFPEGKYEIRGIPTSYTVGTDGVKQLSDDSNFGFFIPNCLKTSVLRTKALKYICFEYTVNEYKQEILQKNDYEYFRNFWCTDTTMQISMKSFRNKNVLIKTDSMFKFRKVTNCDTDYYGATCWYLCRDSVRKTCHCDKNNPKSLDGCRIQCNPGWIFTTILYKLSNISYIMRDCTIRDLCLRNVDCRIRNLDCFQFDNQTVHCYAIDLNYSRQINSTYVTIQSNILFYRDLVMVNLTKFPHINLRVNYTIQLNYNSLSFQIQVFKLIMGHKEPTFEVASDMFVDKLMVCVVIIKWISLNAEVKIVKYFRIFVKATELKLVESKNNSGIVKYIYHGQSLICLSDAKPLYRTVRMWKTHLTKEYFKEILTINYTTPIQTYLIYCEVNLIISPNEPAIKFGKEFKVSVRPYLSFGWNVTDNILSNDVVVACKSQDYVSGFLRTIQLEGFSDISENIILHFQVSIGGKYKFICIWSNKVGNIVIRTLDFRLRTKPYQICLFLFPSTPGGLIQCFHNGHLKDEYTVDITLVIITDTDTRNITGSNIVRLPYMYEYDYIIVYCIVKNRFDKLDYKDSTKKFTIFRQSSHQYIMEKQFKICPSFTQYAEKPIILNFNDKSILLAHEIYYLAYKVSPEWYYIIFILAIYGLYDIMAIGFSVLLVKSSNKNAAISMNTLRLRQMRLRKFNDKMNAAVREILYSPVEKHKFDHMKFSSISISRT